MMVACSLILISSGTLRMPETKKGRLVVTFFFALSKYENPLPTEERSVTEAS